MKSLKLEFTNKGYVFDEAQVEGALNELQTVLVNILSQKGRDPVFDTRGTGLLAAALSGKLLTLNEAQHQSNFAAANTRYFLNQYTDAQDPDAVTGIDIEPTEMLNQKLKVNLSMRTRSGKTIGTTEELGI